MHSSDLEFDCSDEDPDYMPKDGTSSDSDVPLIKIVKNVKDYRTKCKAKTKRQFKADKKNKKKRKKCEDKGDCDAEVQSAIHLSKVEAKSIADEEADHFKRLHQLLKANGLKMNNIARNGDCIFEATVEMVKTSNPLLTSAELRSFICSHMLEYETEYKGYLTSAQSYKSMIEHLQQPGCWNVEIGNVVPYAIANVFQCEVIIYSSHPDMQVVSIHPSLVDHTHPHVNLKTFLRLAYIAIPNLEHYNICIPVDHAMAVVPVLNWDKEKVEVQHNPEPLEIYPLHFVKQETCSDAFDLATDEVPDVILSNIELQPDFCSETDEISDDLLANIEIPSDFTPITSVEDECPNTEPAVGVPNQQEKDTVVNTSALGSTQESQCTDKLNNENHSDMLRKRRKNACPEEWKAIKRGKLRNEGKEYIRRNGEKARAREMKFPLKTMCKFSCEKKFTDVERATMFAEYWALDSKKRKQDFLCSLVKEKQPATCKRETAASPRRNVVRQYFLKYNANEERVCKEHFLATFDISEKVVVTALKYKGMSGFAVQTKVPCSRPNKTSEESLDIIRTHINSFPRMQSHYCRKDTLKEYLDSSLNVVKMHDLYKEECTKKDLKAEKINVYRSVFNREYNLGFHHPKKDRCERCEKFKSGFLSKEEYEQHQNKKQQARDEKASDKEKAKQNKEVHAVTFDLEQVLSVPKSGVSTFYYRRKLNMYNLSVYSLGTGDVSCFLWGETEGKRGASEIGTCLIDYMLSLPSHVTHVILYSDTCTGQNRNQYILTALLYALEKSSSIKVIEQKFLTSGHTEMEVDSVHAAIERSSSVIDIYSYEDWHKVIRLARRKNPYSVILMENCSFLDLKAITRYGNINAKVNRNGERVQWLKICHLRLETGGDIIKYRYAFDEEFKEILVRRTSTRASATTTSSSLERITLYSSAIPISEAKKSDLTYLCKSGAIPTLYHGFYQSLTSENKLDTLPEREELSSQDEEPTYSK